MFEIHTFVSYGGNGICEITDICERVIDQETKLFYVLKPIRGDGATIFVPVDSDVLVRRMHKLMNAEEAKYLIRCMPNTEADWVEDDRERNEQQKTILSGGDRMALVRMTKSLYERKQQLAAHGKRLRANDAQALRQGEEVLFGELAVALGIERDQVLACIMETLSESEQSSEIF